jgi:hypothetical protein
MQLDPHFEERDLKFKQMELDPVTGVFRSITQRGLVGAVLSVAAAVFKT